MLVWVVAPYTEVRVYEHRLIAGLQHESVHHRNGNKQDNRPENLEPTTKSAHTKIHHPLSFDLDEAARLYADGYSFQDLADRYGLRPETMVRTFKRYGLKARTISEANLFGWHKRKNAQCHAN